jgi:hypothetical protein
MFSAYDGIGIAGISLSLYCYGRMQWRPEFGNRIIFSVLNLSSAVLLGISLIHDWNLASFVSNTIWGVMSLYGLKRSTRLLRRSHLHISPRRRQRSLSEPRLGAQ